METKVTSSDRIDVRDNFNLLDYRAKCPYEDETQAVADLKRCLVYCEVVPPIYMIKTYDGINDLAKVSYTNEQVAKQILKKIIIKTKIINNKVKQYSAWDLFMDNQLEFTVKSLKFYSEDPQVFSYFRGYDYNQLDEVKEKIIEPFLNHIKTVIANNNEEVYKYILVWVASILQKPNFKTGTALVILGKQGSGKNLFTNVIKININQKNEPERLAENVANFIMVSNNNIPIKIENSDRRYLVTTTSDAHLKDYKYFDNLFAQFNEQFYENLFTFFMTLDISNTNLRRIPETEAKETIVQASMSSYEMFVREHWEDIEDIPGPRLFDLYNQFVEKNKFAACSSRTFIANIKQFTGQPKTKRIDKKPTSVYSLLPEVRSKFQKMDAELEAKICGELPGQIDFNE